MAVEIKFRGAVTFENDDDLQKGLSAAEEIINEHGEDSLLTPEQLQTLGLHVTVSHITTCSLEQAEKSKKIIHTLVAQSYSGYIDVTIAGEQERFHAKEINPIQLDVTDIAD